MEGKRFKVVQGRLNKIQQEKNAIFFGILEPQFLELTPAKSINLHILWNDQFYIWI